VLFAVKNVGLELPTRKRGPGIKSGLQLCYFWKKEAIYCLNLEITTGCTLTYFTAGCTLVASFFQLFFFASQGLVSKVCFFNPLCSID
jgi:hypothetical protein